jgi:hypothetical protein
VTLALGSGLFPFATMCRSILRNIVRACFLLQTGAIPFYPSQIATLHISIPARPSHNTAPTLFSSLKMRLSQIFLVTLPLPTLSPTGNIVLSNDDGWAEINIRQFYYALTKAGNSVIISAPADNKSGTGSADLPATTRLTPCEFNSCPAGSPAEGFNSSMKRFNYVNSWVFIRITCNYTILTSQVSGNLNAIRHPDARASILRWAPRYCRGGIQRWREPGDDCLDFWNRWCGDRGRQGGDPRDCIQRQDRLADGVECECVDL